MWWHFTLSTLRPTNTRPVQAAMTGELANGGVGDDQKISLLQPWLSVRSSPVLSITPVPALPTPTRGSQDKSIYYETQFSTSTAPALLQLSQARYILHLEICLFPTYDINIVQFIKSLHHCQYWAECYSRTYEKSCYPPLLWCLDVSSSSPVLLAVSVPGLGVKTLQTAPTKL